MQKPTLTEIKVWVFFKAMILLSFQRFILCQAFMPRVA